MLYCKNGLAVDRAVSYGFNLTARSSKILGFKAHIPIIELLAFAKKDMRALIVLVLTIAIIIGYGFGACSPISERARRMNVTTISTSFFVYLESFNGLSTTKISMSGNMSL